MKITLLNRIGFFVALLFIISGTHLQAQPDTADITSQNVLDVMQRVADWQLANPSPHKPTDWTQAAGDAGFMALAGISGDSKYRDAMMAMGQANSWQPGPRQYHADDHCVGQTYAELFFLYRNPKMIAPLRARFDYILDHPSTAASLLFNQPGNKEREIWSWCDSLFMAPPAWMRLYAATDDPRYMDFAVTNWWRATDFLYDKDQHLYFRDSTYFDKTEPNGQKVFWSRGNGWVIAGLVRTLQYLPMNHPDRPRFEQLFKDMAAKVLLCQQPDGLWHSGMLDPGDYPKETSGSAFFTYALAWGINQGLLDRASYEPAVDKAWMALVGCVDSDGKLTSVQPMGADPKSFDPDSTEVYGVGAFLLAGSEVYKMVVLEHTKPVVVSVTNPSNFRRDCETVEIHSDAATGYSKGLAGVMDGVSSRILDVQLYASEPGLPENTLLFQADLAPGETRNYCLLNPSVLPAVPQPIVKTFARYVPERFDDYAWESDRIAHRIYGPALETWQHEPLTDSGIDVWVKRTRGLIVDQMYNTMNLFNTNGPSQDDFKVGHTRGDGGLGIWNNGTNYVSKNWHKQQLITTGPIRSEFVLTYDGWDAGNGRMVSETKRIRIDAGSNLSRVESTLSSDDKSPLQVGVGLAERPGENIFVADGAPEIDSWANSTAKGLCVQTPTWMTYWQPQDFVKGVIATAIIMPKNSIETYTNDNPGLAESKFEAPTHTLGEGQPGLRSILAIVPAQVGTPLVYYFGAGWNESGDFPDAKSWNDYVRRFARRVDEPLQVKVGN